MGKILVFGDSIAYGKWDTHGGWVARFRKYIDENYNIEKNGNLQVFNLGIPGDLAVRLVERFEQELKYRVDPQEKNLILIAIGINDSCSSNWMTGKQTPREDFKNAFRKMIDSASTFNCKIIIIGLTPVNPEQMNRVFFLSEEVKEYDSFISDICKEKDVIKCDLIHDLVNTDYIGCILDRVHPNSQGHEILFEKIKGFLDSRGLIEFCTN